MTDRPATPTPDRTDPAHLAGLPGDRPSDAPGDLADPLPIEPVAGPVTATVRVPGSKSLTNRALPAAALARGTSVVTGLGEGDDVDAMVDALRTLGVAIDLGADRTAAVTGAGGPLPATADGPVTVHVRQSGTTARFLTAILAVGTQPVRIEADPQMQGRPMGPLVDVLHDLGAEVRSDGRPGTLPATVTPASAAGFAEITLPGGISSQFVSGLLLAAPLRGGVAITLEPPIVSMPYLTMTAAVMDAFGVATTVDGDGRCRVAPGAAYRATRYAVEPDASGASYFFGAAAITGSAVTVPDLGAGSLQGDLRFVHLLADMGAAVEVGPGATTVTGTGTLSGIDVDLADLSDTVPTLAVVAAFADTPTRIRGVGFIRHKESDRIGNVVRELRRAGVAATEHDDGLTVDPTASDARPAVIDTYDDHRMAMAFSLLGLRVPGIAIAGPACVAKTYPGYWVDLARLRGAHP